MWKSGLDFHISKFPSSRFPVEFPVLARTRKGGLMRNHISHLAIALLTAAFGIACTGGNDRVNNPRREQSGGTRGVNERISLQGCIQEAPGSNQFVLRDVVE